MFFMKKKFVWSLLFVSVLFFSFIVPEKVFANEEYTSNTEANRKAVELLRELDEVEKCPFPLENLTTEAPISDFKISPRLTFPGVVSWRRINQRATVYGINQIYSRELAPVGFNWYDNGIPTSCVRISYDMFSFVSGRVWDSGFGAWDQGKYWRNFSTSQGSFWANVGSLNQLLYK